MIIESPTNPLMRVVDIAATSAFVHRACPGALVVVDNTFASPYFQVRTQHNTTFKYFLIPRNTLGLFYCTPVHIVKLYLFIVYSLHYTVIFSPAENFSLDKSSDQ